MTRLPRSSLWPKKTATPLRRPLVAARQGNTVMVASEESAIRAVLPEPDRVWAPKAGEPVTARVKDMDWPIHGDLHLDPSEISCAVAGTEDTCALEEASV